MSFEYTLSRIETALARLPNTPDTMAVSPCGWWSLTQVVLAGFLLTYLFGVFQDFQRVRDLRAEPSPLSKVIIITKHEAWNRVYPRLTRSATAEGATQTLAASTLRP